MVQIKTVSILLVMVGQGGLRVAEGASLSVGSLAMPPGSTTILTISGEIVSEATYGVTILVELVPRPGAVGTLVFTVAPPADIDQAGDPWPGMGMFSAFDTDQTGSATMNGMVDDNGTFLPGTVSFSGPLLHSPLTASASANGVWDVFLSTSSGDSGWEGVATTLTSGTIMVLPWACLENVDCDDDDPCTDDFCDAGLCEYTNHWPPCDDVGDTPVERHPIIIHPLTWP